MEAGGRYRPAGCEPRSRTAIIVPHRAREQHLRLLLYHLHPFLQRQQLAYGIYVVHQVPPPRCAPTPSWGKPRARVRPWCGGRRWGGPGGAVPAAPPSLFGRGYPHATTFPLWKRDWTDWG